MHSKSILKTATVIMFIAYITAFNYGGCGDIGGSSGSSGTPTATAQVTSPTPSNSATNVITTTQVSWASVSGATSYDVFFGTTAPGTFVGNQSGTSYNPDTLTYSTTYYWRIDSKNSVGTTTGNVWTFITQIAPSAQVTSPSPANNTINASINQQLGWASASGATSYDVYFGTTSPGTFIINQSGTSYNPGTFTYSTTYYWRIDSKNATGTTTGTVWSFTTQIAPPLSLNVAVISSSQIDLTWTDNTDNETGYKIERKTGSGGTYSQIADIGANIITYSNTGLVDGAIYYYRVRAYNATTNSAYSNEASDAIALNAPTILSANTVSTSQINLTWTDNSSNEDGFKIECKTGAGGIWTQITTVSANLTTYSNTGLTDGTVYSYRIMAYNSNGDSTYTNEASATTLLIAPLGLLTIISRTAIALYWIDTTDNEDGYEIERGVTNTAYSLLITVTANTSVYTDTNLSLSSTYYYRVRAYNNVAASAYSNEVYVRARDWSVIAAGSGHTIALKIDGSLYAWGQNFYGELGDGTTTNRLTPTRIGTDTNWSAIDAGVGYNIALKIDGTLWAWGDNAYGQLGDGTIGTNKNTPTRIGTDTDWLAIAAGGWHTIALKANGSLWTWGYNEYGQLGDGTTISKTTPTRIGTENNWSVIAAGYEHTVALKSDGSLYTWGWNRSGQLGDGTSGYGTNKLIPTLIGTGWSAIAAGWYHTIALKSDGSLHTWGSNGYGALADGTIYANLTPTLIGTGFSAIAAGEEHAIALKTDGTLWAWGSNGFGRLGDGTTINKNTPTLIGTGWSAIAAGGAHTSALKTDGSFWAWGLNDNGQLGDGTTTQRNTPTQAGQ
ncbi:MAG: fibronectin type III domain-containing protein [Candidatus Brocadiia bacterium]